jgi:hypothetical protein
LRTVVSAQPLRRCGDAEMRTCWDIEI